SASAWSLSSRNTTHQAPAAGTWPWGTKVKLAGSTPQMGWRSWFHWWSKAGSMACTAVVEIAGASLMTAIDSMGVSPPVTHSVMLHSYPAPFLTVRIHLQRACHAVWSSATLDDA